MKMDKRIVAAVGIIAALAVIFVAVPGADESDATYYIIDDVNGDITVSAGDNLAIVMDFELDSGDSIRLMPGATVSVYDSPLTTVTSETLVTVVGTITGATETVGTSQVMTLDISDGGSLNIETSLDNEMQSASMEIALVGGPGYEMTLTALYTGAMTGVIDLNIPRIELNMISGPPTNPDQSGDTTIIAGYEMTSESVIEGVTGAIALSIPGNSIVIDDGNGNPARISIGSMNSDMTVTSGGQTISQTSTVSGTTILLSTADDGSLSFEADVGDMSSSGDSGTMSVRDVSLSGKVAMAMPDAGALGEMSISSVDGSFGIGAISMDMDYAGSRIYADVGNASGTFSYTAADPLEGTGESTAATLSTDSIRFGMDVSGPTQMYELEGSANNISLEYRDVTSEATVAQGPSFSIKVGEASMSGNMMLGDYAVGIDADVSGLEFANGENGESLALASASIDIDNLMFDSIRFTVSDIGDTPENGMTIGSIRLDATGTDGESGYMTISDVTSDSGNLEFAFGHSTYMAVELLPFFVYENGYLTFGPGTSVTLNDSYMMPFSVAGADVTGTAYLCSTSGIRVSDGTNTLTSGYSDAPFDVEVVFSDSKMESARILLCANPVYADWFGPIQPYDETSGGIPYVVNGDGTATLSSVNGEIDTGIALTSYTVTVFGQSSEYQVGDEIPVTTEEVRENETFAGFTDGYRFVPLGGSYVVMYDATVTEVWVPSSYSVSYSNGVATVDLGDGTEYYCADVAGLRSEMAANGAQTLVIRNSVGTLSIPVDNIPSSGPVSVELSSHASSPITGVSMVAGDKAVYMIQVTGLTAPAYGSPTCTVTLNATGQPVMAMNGMKVGLPYSADDGTTTFNVSESGTLGMYAYVMEPVSTGQDDDGGDSNMLIIAGVVIVIVIVAAIAVVVMRRRGV